MGVVQGSIPCKSIFFASSWTSLWCLSVFLDVELGGVPSLARSSGTTKSKEALQSHGSLTLEIYVFDYSSIRLQYAILSFMVR